MKELEISWMWSGSDKHYHVTMNGDDVFITESKYERDMFIAEFKAKIILSNQELLDPYEEGRGKCELKRCCSLCDFF